MQKIHGVTLIKKGNQLYMKHDPKCFFKSINTMREHKDKEIH